MPKTSKPKIENFRTDNFILHESLPFKYEIALKTAHLTEQKLLKEWRNNKISNNAFELRCLHTPKLSGPEDLCHKFSTSTTFKWSYDPDTNSCSRFKYNGCKGNGNRFVTKKGCENSCQMKVDSDFQIRELLQARAKVKLEEHKATCFSVPQPNVYRGTGKGQNQCNLNQTRWVFKSKKCVPIIYKGCDEGTPNIFVTKDHCLNFCGKFI